MSDLPPSHSTVSQFPSTKLADRSDLCVLILGKDSDSRFLYKTLLELWGFCVEESDDVENSLSIIKKQKTNLILLDSVSSFNENLEIIRRLREDKFSKNIPLILLSGFSQPLFESLSLKVGADDFFVKPVDFDLLETCLKNNINETFEKFSPG